MVTVAEDEEVVRELERVQERFGVVAEGVLRFREDGVGREDGEDLVAD